MALGALTCTVADGIGWPGWFVSEQEEVVNPTQIVVASGRVPTWLKGSLIRTGSGLYENGKHRFGHVFDGHAKLNKILFNDTGVFFQTRFVQTDLYKESIKKNDIAPHLTFYPVIPPWKLNPKVLTGPTDAANINVWTTGTAIYAGCEQLTTTSFDPDSLATLGHTKFSPANGAAGTLAHSYPRQAPDNPKTRLPARVAAVATLTNAET